MIYDIPTTYTVWGVQKIEADSLEEAKIKALDSLPPVTEYIEDSQQVDEEALDFFLLQPKSGKKNLPEFSLKELIHYYYSDFPDLFTEEEMEKLTEDYIKAFKEQFGDRFN